MTRTRQGPSPQAAGTARPAGRGGREEPRLRPPRRKLSRASPAASAGHRPECGLLSQPRHFPRAPRHLDRPLDTPSQDPTPPPGVTPAGSPLPSVGAPWPPHPSQPSHVQPWMTVSRVHCPVRPPGATVTLPAPGQTPRTSPPPRTRGRDGGFPHNALRGRRQPRASGQSRLARGPVWHAPRFEQMEGNGRS